jgi:hypothetical protein
MKSWREMPHTGCDSAAGDNKTRDTGTGRGRWSDGRGRWSEESGGSGLDKSLHLPMKSIEKQETKETGRCLGTEKKALRRIKI